MRGRVGEGCLWFFEQRALKPGIFFSRTFLRPHNVSHRRKLPRPKGAYRVLAKRQPARGARYREVQHVTQRERVWRTRQRRHGPDSRRGAGDGAP